MSIAEMLLVEVGLLKERPLKLQQSKRIMFGLCLRGGLPDCLDPVCGDLADLFLAAQS
jgi:hypothetical protein